MSDTWKQGLAPYIPVATVLGTLVAILAFITFLYRFSDQRPKPHHQCSLRCAGRSVRGDCDRFEAIETRFGAIERSISDLKESTEIRFEAVDARFVSIERSISDLKENMDVRFQSLERLIIGLDRSVETRITGLESNLDARV